jgi:hypothetical protein
MKTLAYLAKTLLCIAIGSTLSMSAVAADPLHDRGGARCPGERLDIKTISGGTSPYVELHAGRRTGSFLLDYGTTQSSLARDFVRRDASSASDSVVENFSLPTFASGQFLLSDYGRLDQPPGGQLGTVGTDFLSLLTADFSFRGGRGDVILSAQSCDPNMLRARGMVPVRQRGFLSSDLKTVDSAMPNVPVLFLKIGGISTFAQIDTGYDDRAFPPSIDINDALYEKLVASGVALTSRGEASIATCRGIATNNVFATPTVISLQTDEGRNIRPLVGAVLIRKKANGCGGIADMRSPAAQLGMSIISGFGAIVIDPRAGIVWIPER